MKEQQLFMCKSLSSYRHFVRGATQSRNLFR